MKRILPVAVALAFAAFVTGCDQNNANRPAGSGGTASTPSTPSTPATPDQQKRGTQSPSKP